MFRDNKLSVWNGPGLWLFSGISKLKSPQTREVVIISENQVLKRFHRALCQMTLVGVGAPQPLNWEQKHYSLSEMSRYLVKKIAVERPLTVALSRRSLADRNQDQKTAFKPVFSFNIFFWLENYRTICKKKKKYRNSLNETMLSLALSLQICEGPHHERKNKASKPGISHCFSSPQMSWRPRNFCSLGDTIDADRLWNNDLSLPLSKGERRQWLVTNMVQSLPDHMKRHHRTSHIPDAFLVMCTDRKWCFSYNGLGADSETSCHTTSQPRFWGLSN